MGMSMRCDSGLLALVLSGCHAAPDAAPAGGIAHLPANNARNVDPDTHLMLTFPARQRSGLSGLIRIYRCGETIIWSTRST